MLFDEAAIAARVRAVAGDIAGRSPRPELAVGILTGAFVFAADLLRALSRCGLDLPVEFMSLSRYGAAREGVAEFAVRLPPGAAVAGKRILLLDGVLDHGHTLAKARTLLFAAGATGVTIAVAIDKTRHDAVLKADYAAFSGVDCFVVGYGMDDAGSGRGLPDVAAVE